MICVQSNLTSAPKFAYTISEQNLAEMSLTPPADNSRSSSPGGEPKARAVSGSLKDRIARFNNPSATPLVPAHPFGTSGPAPPGSNARGGLVGNRIPSLDPRSAGMLGGQRKVSEGKGLIGNRIPSVTGVEKAPSGRSASPAGSVGSSVASGRAASSNSPVTSRASSPPTSPGPGLPPSLLAATLPDLDMGGPGAMTPSSTRAEAGEPTSELSRPTTPVQPPASGAHYDLNQPNLDNLAETSKAKSSSLQVGGDVPPPGGSLSALGSSRASQYDPSADGSENPKKMMEDVSGVSTPMGTPKAERVDIEMRSTQGSVVGDNDMEDLQARLKGLDVPDRDATPEPVAEVLTPQKTPEAQAQQPLEEMSTPKSVKNEVVEPIDIGGAQGDHDPNTDPDLDDLKAGELSTDTEALAEEKEPGTVVDSMAEAGLVQGLGEEVIPESEQKQQGGVAGQQVEDIEHPTQVEQPKPDESTEYADNQELDVRTVTSDASPAQDSAAQPQQEQSEGSTTQQGPKDDGFDVETQPAQLNDQDTMPDIIEGARASGVRLSDAEKAGTGPTTSGEVDHLKDHLQQERLERGERREETEKAGELQTEEDRDEGAPRREQLVKALDQNKNPDADEEGEVSQETKDAARAATEQIVGPVEKQVDEDAPADGAKDTADEVDNSTKAIGDVPSEDKADNSGKPLQIHIEPAPIAQPADDDITPPASASAPDDAGLQTQAEPEVEVSAAAFPTPPSGEPSGFDESAKSDSSTPIDPTVVKSFPDVPDEAKPRVEVHVPSSPVQSPAKLATASAQPIIAAPDTPTKGATESTLTTPNTRSSLDSDKGSKLSKRASMSYSPKSPYLDDEVPQDFQGGWATVTKGRET